MPTATKRPPSPIKDLERLEASVSGRRAEARAAAQEHNAANSQARALQDQRHRLVHRDPGLVDHVGQPNPEITDNPVSAIDAELKELPDVADLAARSTHKQSLAEQAQRQLETFISENIDAIRAGFAPTGQQLTDDANAAIKEAAARVDALVGHSQRLAGLAAAARQNTRVRGLEANANLARGLHGIGAQTPELEH